MKEPGGEPVVGLVPAGRRRTEPNGHPAGAALARNTAVFNECDFTGSETCSAQRYSDWGSGRLGLAGWTDWC